MTASFKRNVVAGYASQIYITLASLLILPLYLKYMGAEPYGLVGFFTMLQAWFNLLDVGLTPTVARETARFRGGALSALSYRRLLRALQVLFFAFALLSGGVIFTFSGAIAAGWLKAEALPVDQLRLSLQLMAGCAALRWISGLYRGCVSGSEQLVWLNAFNSFVATFRFFGVLPVLIWVDNSAESFFKYQLLVALIELIGLTLKARSLFPDISFEEKIGWSVHSLLAPIKSNLKFSLTIAFTSVAWVLITQTDKLILSKMLTLTDYGYFTLAVLAAGGVMIIAAPISGALLPRMARLQAAGDDAGLVDIYRNATQMVAVIAFPVCLILVFFAEEVLLVWTGNSNLAAHSALVLRLYAIGNGFLIFSSFPYYLQYSKGDLKLHFIGNFLFLVFLIPLLLWAAERHGSIGAGFAWLISNAIYFFFCTIAVHTKFYAGLQRKWLVADLGAVLLPGLCVALILYLFAPMTQIRWVLSLFLIVGGLAVMASCAVGFRKIKNVIAG